MLNKVASRLNRTAIAFAVTALVGVLTTSCGSKDKENAVSKSVFNDSSYVVVKSTDLKGNNQTLTGTGSIVFENPLPDVTSNNSYSLQFSLNDGGSVTLVTHASNQLTGGVAVRFTRKDKKLVVELQANGKTTNASLPFISVDASTGKLSYQIDIHNDETPSHVLVWNAEKGDFREETALLNSETDKLSAPGKGTGTFWGIQLEKSTVTIAKVSKAKSAK